MIRSFGDKETERIWRQEMSKKLPPAMQGVALRKLFMLAHAQRIDDLRVPPANRLEKLKGKRDGLHSIRINDQWRMCFRWEDDGAHDVSIVDYH